MAYPSEGTLTTDEREVAVSETWDSSSDWNAAQSMNNVVVENGVVMLEEITVPAAVVSLYEYEDDSDTSVAVDSLGSNDADITGASYTTNNVAVGSSALSHDGNDDETNSQNTVDLSAVGDTDGFGFGGRVYPNSVGTAGYFYSHDRNIDNTVGIQDSGATSGNARIVVTVGGTQIVGSHAAITQDTQQHVWANITETDLVLFIDGTQQASDSHSYDLTTLGACTHRTAKNSQAGSYAHFVADDFGVSDDPLSQGELDDLIARGN